MTVVVRDPTEKEPNPVCTADTSTVLHYCVYRQVGKQWAGGERDSGFIFYTATSGIWQSVRTLQPFTV